MSNIIFTDNLTFKEAKILVYVCFEHQDKLGKGINDNWWSWMYWCPLCERPVQRLKGIDSPSYDYEGENYEQWKYDGQIVYYICHRCEKIIDKPLTIHKTVEKTAEKFGYSKDCHGYYKEGSTE